MCRETMDRRDMLRRLADVQHSLEDCRAGLYFLGHVFRNCPGLTLTNTHARGLGHIFHGFTADIDGTEGDFEKLEEVFGGRGEERIVDLDQIPGLDRAKD